MPRDFEHMAKSTGHEQSNRRETPLQQRIETDGRPVSNVAYARTLRQQWLQAADTVDWAVDR
jgi:hypothetical protein